MGHDISIISDGMELGYFRAGAFSNDRIGLFYKALDAEEFNNGLSGSGGCKEYSLDNLILAKKRLAYLSGEPIEEVTDISNDEHRTNILSAIKGTFFSENVKITTSSSTLKKDVKDINFFLDGAIGSGYSSFTIEFR